MRHLEQQRYLGIWIACLDTFRLFRKANIIIIEAGVGVVARRMPE